VTKLAFVGGTGFNLIKNLVISNKQMVRTPYGSPSSPIVFAKMNSVDIVFLARHGTGHTISPHQINYRANMWALKDLGVTTILSVVSVGGITPELVPATIAIPDQIIDYTYSRKHTFFDENNVQHIDFTYPYDQTLRQCILTAASNASIDVISSGTYGAMQGPRLETAAEIQRLRRDGCTMVGMTTMPEAALARELGISYASCAVVANWAAGIEDKIISMVEIEKNLVSGMEKIRPILEEFTKLV